MPKSRHALHHHPFGMIMPSRRWYAGSAEECDIGFTGQVQDNVIYGIGNLSVAEYWEYDNRVGK